MTDSKGSKDSKPENEYLFKWLLLVNFLEYLEAGAIPALLLPISDAFDMNAGQLGILGGIVFASISAGGPLAAWLLRRYDHGLVVGLSVAVNNVISLLWAVTPTGKWYSIWLFVALRGLMGFTQACLIVYLPLFANEFAPSNKRTSWMSFLQASVPFGIMSGYILGTVALSIASSMNTNTILGLYCWRWPFILESILLIPLGAIFVIVPKSHVNVRINNINPNLNPNQLLHSVNSDQPAPKYDDEDKVIPESPRVYANESVSSFDSIKNNHNTSRNETDTNNRLQQKECFPKSNAQVMVRHNDENDGDASTNNLIAAEEEDSNYSSSNKETTIICNRHLKDVKQDEGDNFGGGTTSPEEINSSVTPLRIDVLEKRDDDDEEEEEREDHGLVARPEKATGFNTIAYIQTRNSAGSPHSSTSQSNVGYAKFVKSLFAKTKVIFSNCSLVGSFSRPRVFYSEVRNPITIKIAEEEEAGATIATADTDADADVVIKDKLTPCSPSDLDIDSATIPLPVLASTWLVSNSTVLRLLAMPLYRNLLFCLVSLYFTVTGVQYWGTTYFEVTFHANPKLVRSLFIIVAATGPTLGVIVGGAVIDRIGGYKSPTQRVKTLEVCCFIGMLAGLASIPITTSSSLSLVVISLWLLLFFGACVMPSCAGLLVTIVPRRHRPVATSLTVVVINLCGNAASLLVSGWLMEVVRQSSVYTVTDDLLSEYMMHYSCDRKCSLLLGFRVVLSFSIVSLIFLLLSLRAAYDLKNKTFYGKESDNNMQNLKTRNQDQEEAQLEPTAGPTGD